MNMSVECPSPQVPRRTALGRVWIVLAPAIALAGILAIHSTAPVSSGEEVGKIITGSIPGEDWHGNVRRSAP